MYFLYNFYYYYFLFIAAVVRAVVACIFYIAVDVITITTYAITLVTQTPLIYLNYLDI